MPDSSFFFCYHFVPAPLCPAPTANRNKAAQKQKELAKTCEDLYAESGTRLQEGFVQPRLPNQDPE